MRFACLNGKRMITNIIEVEPDLAPLFDAHYLGESLLGIGDQYPKIDLEPPREPTSAERIAALETTKADKTELDAIGAAIEKGLSV